MDHWMWRNASGGNLGTLLDAEAPPFSDDDNLWNRFDITVGLDDSFDQPADNDVLERLENRYNRLGERRRVYSSRNIPRRDALMEELYILGVKFNQAHEIYYQG
jgi:hypothetical protein